MSPYARALSVRLKEPNKDITKVLGLVALDVSAKYEQNPIIRTNLAYDVCLNGGCFIDGSQDKFGNSTPEELAKTVIYALKNNKKEIFLTLIPSKDILAKFIWHKDKKIHSYSEALKILKEPKVVNEIKTKLFYGLWKVLNSEHVNWSTMEYENIKYVMKKEYGMDTTDIYVTLKDKDGQQYKLLLDDCFLIEGRWYMFDELRWLGKI